jgi:hypothetical protein
MGDMADDADEPRELTEAERIKPRTARAAADAVSAQAEYDSHTALRELLARAN